MRRARRKERRCSIRRQRGKCGDALGCCIVLDCGGVGWLRSRGAGGCDARASGVSGMGSYGPAITSYGLFGMLIGALGIGTLADVIGRKRSILISVVSFSVSTALCAFGPTPGVFGILRFLAGLGLGGLIPTAA